MDDSENERRFIRATNTLLFGSGSPETRQTAIRIIADVLRSDTPLDESLRRQLADLIDPSRDYYGQLVWKGKAHRPADPRSMGERMQLALKAAKIVKDHQGQRKAAVLDAMAETGLTRAQVFAAIKWFSDLETYALEQGESKSPKK